MKKTVFSLIGSLILIVSGCSSGIYKEKISQLLDDSKLSSEYTETFQNSLEKTAVWMNIETLDSKGNLHPEWKWTKSDLNIVTSYLDSLVKEKKISSYQFIKTSEIQDKTLDGLIGKTGKNADSAIVVKTIVQLDWYFNPAAILDLTIIGAYWLPGSNRNAYAKTRIEVIDLKSKRTISNFYGEAYTKISKPTFLIDSREAVDNAKANSLRNAFREFYKKISGRTNITM